MSKQGTVHLDIPGTPLSVIVQLTDEGVITDVWSDEVNEMVATRCDMWEDFDDD